MSAALYDIEIEQGATFDPIFTWNDSSQTPIDLTGYTFSGQIRKLYSDSVVAATFTITVLNQITNTGQFQVALTAVQTAALVVDRACGPDFEPTQYVYDIEATSSGGKVYKVLRGKALVSPEVSRA